MTTLTVGRTNALHGAMEIPGDKSISHRAIMLASLAQGKSHIYGALESEDVVATMLSMKAMGVSITRKTSNCFEIYGVGINGLQVPKSHLDMGNSGTAMRLLCGILIGQKFGCELTGDQSLQNRPMDRVTKPLAKMGGNIETSRDGFAPIIIKPSSQIIGIEYDLPVASAQVKSAILLAGMYGRTKTVLYEKIQTRDHTERMLKVFNYPVEIDHGSIQISPNGILKPTQLTVPGDFSSAAFFIVGASIINGSVLNILNVGVNPTRTGLLQILEMMGAKIEIDNLRSVSGEPTADLTIRASKLHGIDIPPALVSTTIDEFPILAIAAAAASGKTSITGANELRLKESDRIATVVNGLREIGIAVTELPDGMIIQGGEFIGGTVDSQGDHRVAMAFAIAGTASIQPVKVLDCKNISTSFPNFIYSCKELGIELK